MSQPQNNFEVKAPTAVTWLGYGGLIPFLALAAVCVLGVQPIAIFRAALIGYGAVILSFVGALHWAFAMTNPGLSDEQRQNLYVWSVVPALLAWPSLLLPMRLAVPLLILGFAAHYWQDQRLARHAQIAAWYLPMRWRLSSLAIISLGAAAVFT